MQSFKTGERVHLSMEPAVHRGAYHPKFIGKTGIVQKSIGKCYEIRINDQGKDKLLVIHPVHLKKSNN